MFLTEAGYVNREAWDAWVTYFLSGLPPLSTREWTLLVLDGFGCHGGDPQVLERLEKERVIFRAPDARLK
jgi:hypothetical protein